MSFFQTPTENLRRCSTVSTISCISRKTGDPVTVVKEEFHPAKSGYPSLRHCSNLCEYVTPLQ